MSIGAGLAIVLFAPGRSLAQTDPTIGVNQFPQYRNLSGLSGGGYGVDIRGYRSLSGPVSLSTPVGYVLGHGQFRLGVARASFTGEPHFFLRTNGTGIITFGETFGRVNVAVTDMFLSVRGDQSFHLQAQYVPAESSLWAASVGVQDWGGGGGSSGVRIAEDSRSSRSVFAVTTYRWVAGERSVYVSFGGGTRRFRQGFVSASAQVLKPVRVWSEHDGFGVNAGVLWTIQEGRGRHAMEMNVLYGMMKLRYAVAAVVVGF